MINKAHFASYLEGTDRLCALAGMGLGLVTVLLSLFEIIHQLSIGLTILCITSIYILLRPKLKSEQEATSLSIPSRLLSLLNIAFWILLTMALLIWYFNQYHRPTSYFIIISILATIIALEIFSFDASHSFWSIFMKIVILSLVLRGGIYFNYPSVIGYDAYFHTKMAEGITLTGHVLPIEISGKYFYAPVLHILISNVGVLCQLPIKYAVFLSIGVISVISTLFIYIIGKSVAGPRVGLFAVLLANLTNQLIMRGIVNITPGSLVLCYFLVILYLFFVDTNHPLIRTVLLILFSLMMIITHQLTTFAVFIILTTLFFSHTFISYTKGVSLHRYPSITAYILFFGISIVIYWMNMSLPNGSTFFDIMLNSFLSMFDGGAYGSDILVVGYSFNQPLFDRVVLQLCYLILPFFAIGGLLLWIGPENEKRFSIAVTAAVLFLIIYGIPLLGFRNPLTDRWMPLLSVLLALLAAAFIYKSANLLSSRSMKTCVVFLIVFIFTFLMITTPGINKDNPLVAEDTTIRNQFTYSELQAARTSASFFYEDVYVDSSFLGAYLYYADALLSDNGPRAHSFDISFNYDSIGTGNLFLLRTCTLHEPVSVKVSSLYGDSTGQPIPQSFFSTFESDHFNRVYDSSYVIGYLSC
ncbi:MAG: hypothetical protein PWQ62_298 [Candidatus Methanomethylophilaceae archaeon]|nr:hypothetical protein [Candidatus Methanomethylophilaceae archaeon]